MIDKSMIEEKIVSMQFDNKDFEKDTKQTISTLDKLKVALGALAGAGAGLGSVAIAAKKITFDPVNDQIQIGIGKVVALTAALTGVVNITDELYGVVTRTIRSFSFDQIAGGFSKYEEKISGVQVIMNAVREVGESEEETLERIEPYMEKLSQFADETSYDFTEMVANVGRFTSAGLDLNQTVTAIMGIANWSAKAGASTQAASTAMYQLSQALGRGAIHLEDWKSIMNLHMDTDEFKREAIETAAAVGSLNKVGNAFYTKSGEEVTVADFTGNLNKDWFTVEAFMKLAEKYGSAVDIVLARMDETGESASEALRKLREEGVLSAEDLGTQAFQAAMEAKTLTEALESIRVAVASKFERIYEAIFGNFIESRDLWTSMSETLWGMFAGPVDTIASIFEKWKDTGGRDKLFRSLSRIWEQIAKTSERVGEAWTEIFGELDEFTGKKILDKINDKIFWFSNYVKNLLFNLRSNETIWENLEKFFLVFKKFIENTKASLTIIKERVIKPFAEKIFPKLIETFGDIIGKLSDYINKLQDAYIKNDTFNQIVDRAIYLYEIIADKIIAIGEAFKAAFGNKEAKTAAETIETISEQTSKLSENVSFIEKFEKAFTKIGTFLSNAFSDIYPLLASVWEFIKIIFVWIGTTLQNLGPMIMASFNFLKEQLDKFVKYLTDFIAIQDASDKSALELIGEWIAAGLQYLFDKLKNIDTDKLNGWLESIEHLSQIILNIVAIWIAINDDWYTLSEIANPFAPIFQGLNDFLYYQGTAKRSSGRAAILKSFGLLILEIAAALYVLAQIPADDLARSIDTLIPMIVAVAIVISKLWESLSVGMTAWGKFGGITKFAQGVKLFFSNMFSFLFNGLAVSVKISSFATIISAIGIALLEMAAAVYILGSIDSDKLVYAIIGIIALGIMLHTMISSYAKMFQNPKDMIVLTILAPAMIMLAAALVVISLAAKILASMDVEELARSIISIGIIMALMVALTASAEVVNPGKVLAMSVAITVIGNAILKLAAAIFIMSLVQDVDMLNAITMMLGMFMGFMVALLGLSSLVAKNIWALMALAIAVDMVTLAIVAIGGIIVALAHIKNPKRAADSMEQIGIVMIAMAGFLTYLVILANSLTHMGKLDGSKIGALLALAGILDSMIIPITGITASLMLISSSASSEDILSSGGALSMVLMTMGGVLALISQMNPASIGNLFAFAGAFSILAAGLLVLAPALKMLGDVPLDVIGLVLGSITAAFLLILQALNIMGGADSLLKIAGIIAILAGSLALVGVGLALTAYALKLVVDEIIALTNVSEDQWENLGHNITSGIFKTILNGLTHFGPQLVEAWDGIVLGLLTSITKHQTKLTEALAALMTSLCEGINNSLPALLDFLKKLFGEFLPQVWPPIRDFIEDVIYELTEYAIKTLNEEVPKLNEHLENATWDLFIRILRLLNKGVPMLNAELALEGMNLIWWVDRLLSYFEDTVLAHTVTLLDKLNNKLPLIIEKLIELAILCIIGVIRGIIDAAMEIYDDLKELLETMLDLLMMILDADWDVIEKDAMELIDRLGEATEKYIETQSKAGGVIWRVAWAIVKGLATALAEVWSQYPWQIGYWAKQLTNGITKGVEAKRYDLKKVGGSMVKDISEGVKKEGEIRSPSKLMERLGKYFPEGLGIGIQSGFGKIGSIATDMAHIVIDNFKKHFATDEMKNIVSQLGDGILDGFSGDLANNGIMDFGSMIDSFKNLNPTITPTLDLGEIEKGLPQLQDMFDKQSVDGLGIYGVDEYAHLAHPTTGLDSVSMSKQLEELTNKFNSYSKVNEYNTLDPELDRHINIELDGNLKQFIKATAKENNKIIKATNVNLLANK